MKNFIYAVCLLLLSVSAPAIAQDASKRICIRESNQDQRFCVQECNREHRDDLLICSASGNEERQQCLQVCAADRDTCLTPLRDARRACHEACDSNFDSAIATCRLSCPAGNCDGDATFIACRDQAKVDRYACNLACKRQDQSNVSARKACFKTFRTCVKACRGN
jgi:hypothetical protein